MTSTFTYHPEGIEPLPPCPDCGGELQWLEINLPDGRGSRWFVGCTEPFCFYEDPNRQGSDDDFPLLPDAEGEL